MTGTNSQDHVHEALIERIAVEEIQPRIDDAIIEEHREDPFGPHSDDLHRVETFLRRLAGANRHMVITTIPHEEWAVGKQSGVRGDPPELLDGERYDTQKAAEHAVFRKRLEAFRERFGENAGGD